MKAILSKTLNLASWAKVKSYSDTSEVEEQPEGSIFQLLDANKTDNKQKISIWRWTNNKNPNQRSIAIGSIQQLKKLQHPYILKYINEEISDSEVVLMTEHVITLRSYLKLIETFPEKYKNELIAYGILNIFKVYDFVRQTCDIQHAISIGSVFVNDRLEWKLGSFENAIDSYRTQIFSNVKRPLLHLSDIHYYFIVFIYSIFNTDRIITNTRNVPKYIRSVYRMLLSENNEKDKNTEFLTSPCFTTKFMYFMEKMNNILVLTTQDIVDLLNRHKDLINELPSYVQCQSILMLLIDKIQICGIIPELVETCISIIKNIPPDDNPDIIIIDFITSLYKSNDRHIRSLIIKNHEYLIRPMDSKIINDFIFPTILAGLSDPSPYTRESSLKAIVTTTPHLTESNVKSKLLPQLARSQMDQNPILRANTNVCISKISKYIPANILTVAVLRGIGDPFDLSKRASLITIQSNCEIFDLPQIAIKLIPACSSVLVDAPKDVRLLALNTITTLLKYSSTLIESISDAAPPDETVISSAKKIGEWFVSNLKNVKQEPNIVETKEESQLPDPIIAKYPYQPQEIKAKFDVDDINSKKSESTDEENNGNISLKHTISLSSSHAKPIISINKLDNTKNISGWDWNDDW